MNQKDKADSTQYPAESKAYRRAMRVLIIIVTIGVSLLTLVLPAMRPPYFKLVNQETAITLPESPKTRLTSNTTRIPGRSAIELAVAISQIIYPATFNDNKPKAVILVRDDQPLEALMAVQVVHFPIDAPILYTKTNSLPDLTRKELERLDPEGFPRDRNVQVYLVGQLGPEVNQRVAELGFKTRELKAATIYRLSAVIDEFRSTIAVDHRDEVLLVPVDKPIYALPAVSYVAHAGARLFFIDKDTLNPAVAAQLAKRPQDAFIYLMGPPGTISLEVIQELNKYGHVQQIPGTDPESISTGFAGYKDIGANFAWWFRANARNFGWGISEAGHNFIFASTNTLTPSIPAAVLAHRGKHGPILLVDPEKLPKAIENFLKIVQPIDVGHGEQLYNHGWIIGDYITSRLQDEIEELLQPKTTE